MREEAKKYFYCYNVKMGQYLKSQGLDYITMAKNRFDGSLFTLWEKIDEFEKVISNYNK